MRALSAGVVFSNPTCRAEWQPSETAVHFQMSYQAYCHRLSGWMKNVTSPGCLYGAGALESAEHHFSTFLNLKVLMGTRAITPRSTTSLVEKSSG